MTVASYTVTPANPWALPTFKAHPRIFLTPTRLARLQSLWNSPPASMTQLKATWPGGSTSTDAIHVMGNLMNYLATGNLTALTNAYNGAIAVAGAGAGTTLYAPTAPYVFDWGYADLSSAQKTALIANIDASATSYFNLPSNGMLTGCGQEQGYGGFAVNTIAIAGETGATNRNTNLRNMIQNICGFIDETMGDGIWVAYPYEVVYFINACVMNWHIAGSIENLLPSRLRFLANRAKWITYNSTAGGWNLLCEPTDQRAQGSDTNAPPNQEGTPWTLKPEMGYNFAVYAEILNDGLAQTSCNAVVNGSPTLKWTTGVDSMTASPTWLAFMFYDSTIAPVAPSTLPNSAVFPLPGVVAYRGGWSNPATTVRGWLRSKMYNDHGHDSHHAGVLEIWRGDSQLICNEYTYAGQPSAWQDGTNSAREVGNYNMCKSTVVFCPTGSATPDRSGSQTHVATPGSPAAFPITNSIDGNHVWLHGTVKNFVYGGSSPGAKAQATADYGSAYYPNTTVTSVQRIVAYVNGADEAHGTFFVQDNFTLVPGSVDRIKALWGCRAKPVGMTSETVVTGVSLAGVMTYPNQKVAIQWRGSQAVIQMVSPAPTALRLVGGGNGIAGAPAGPGYESYFDGANVDFTLNAQQSPIQGQQRMKGLWRVECETTPAAANGQMLFAITVGAAGETAPTYTEAQVLAIMSGAGSTPTMPGLTQVAQRAALDAEFSVTRYLSAFSTQPADDGTGGVEPTGNNYARKAILSTDWGAASGGGPASKANSTIQQFNTASGSWGSIVGWGAWDSASGGVLRWADFMGNFPWAPFTCTSASPGVLRSPGHGLATNDLVAVTAKYGGTLPTTAGSWTYPLTATVIDADNFSVGVNTTNTGEGQFRKVVPVSVTSGQIFTFQVGDLKVTMG